MCGIVGYIGKDDGTEICLKGLKRLEYRGYDSAGMAVVDNQEIKAIRVKGRVAALEEKQRSNPLKGSLVIAHTRWATHGVPSEENAHPHFDCHKQFAVVHNGIIENYASLKRWLEEKGHKFTSQTDTEVIPHLIEDYYEGDLVATVQKVLSLVEGTYGLAIISAKEPDKMVAARCGSPLILGICDNGDYIVASDPTAVVEYTRKVVYLNDREVVVLNHGSYQIFTLDNKEVEREISEIAWDLAQIEKGGFPHFMLKEIFNQPDTVSNAMRGRIILSENKVHPVKSCEAGAAKPLFNGVKLGGLVDYLDFLAKSERMVFMACGTSWHAGLIAEYLFENLAGLPTEVEYASEFRYKGSIVNTDTPYFVISQSGETADTLESLRKVKNAGGKVFGIVNVVGSTIARETDAGIYLHAGPEIGVASTKAFTSQVTVLSLLALYLAKARGKISDEDMQARLNSVLSLPKIIEKILKTSDSIRNIAEKYIKYNNFLYLGRGYNFPVALEGALKLKEISYIHAEGYPAAEMKHGPIALIDQNMPVVVIATDTEDIIYQKVMSNIEEVRARGGNIIAIATEGNEDIKNFATEVIYVPKTAGFISPIVNVIPLQLLSYYMAAARGCDIDKPRNLAKSVTVE